MDKKYELVRCDKVPIRQRSVFYSTIYQVKYLRDIPRYDVKAGQLGGYVNGEHNLNQEGDCCVLDGAMILADAVVRENAIVRDNATVTCRAVVFDSATIRDNAFITLDAIVRGNATIAMNATITGNCVISDHTVVDGGVELTGDLKVSNNAHIGGPKDYYKISTGNIALNASIESDRDLLVIGPMGSRFAYTTFYKSSDNQIYVKCGCFSGTLENFERQVNDVHGCDEYGDRYRKAIEAAKQMIELK